MTISVLVVDDNVAMRRGLAATIAAFDGIVVAGEAASGEEAIQLTRTTNPDIVLLDVNMPGMNGIDTVRILSPQHKVIMLSGLDDRETVATCIRHGASGYLTSENLDAENLEDAIVKVASGGNVLSDALVPKVFSELQRQTAEWLSTWRSDLVERCRLTERETDVLDLMAEGYSNPKIAAALFIAGKTVKNHTNNIFGKLENCLGTPITRAEAIVLWLGRGRT